MLLVKSILRGLLIESPHLICGRHGLVCWILHEYLKSDMDCICQEEDDITGDIVAYGGSRGSSDGGGDGSGAGRRVGLTISG